MSYWPETMKLGPVRDWPGVLTSERRDSPFRAPLKETLKVLEREIYHLATTSEHQESAELLVAVPAGAFRLDGRPYANARPGHPGVIFSMDTRHGRVSYPCDTFTTWQDNLRAIALALESLRRVDRYGVTKSGEQYRGFLAIESGTAPAAGFASADEAHQWLGETYGYVVRRGDQAQARGILRTGQRKSHPDLGGDSELWPLVSRAEAILREAGWL